MRCLPANQENAIAGNFRAVADPNETEVRLSRLLSQTDQAEDL